MRTIHCVRADRPAERALQDRLCRSDRYDRQSRSDKALPMREPRWLVSVSLGRGMRATGSGANLAPCSSSSHRNLPDATPQEAEHEGSQHCGKQLFVIRDSAALIADARLKSLLWDRLGRTWFREIVVNRDNASFRCVLNRLIRSLSDRVVLERQGSNINVQQRRTFIRRDLAVGEVVAEYIEIAVVELLIAWIIEFAECRSLIGLERANGAVEHRSRFLRSAELLSADRCSTP